MGMVDEATNAEAAAALAPVTAAGTLAQDVAATTSTVAGAAVQAPSLAEWSVNPASTSSRQSGGSSSAAGELDGPAQAIETAGEAAHAKAMAEADAAAAAAEVGLPSPRGKKRPPPPSPSAGGPSGSVA